MLKNSKALEVIKQFKLEARIGEATKYKDKKGRIICIGSLVDYWFDADYGYGKWQEKEFTRMEDVVVEVDGCLYFWDPEYGGGDIERHFQFSYITGQVNNGGAQ